MKIYRKDGEIIHIGEWDHEFVELLNPDYDSLPDAEKKAMIEAGRDPEYLYDEGGRKIVIDRNPAPDGAVVSDEPVETLPDGSRVATDDYRRKRLADYPSLPDQLDMIYHDRVNGTDNWFEAIAGVKRKHPKPV